MREGVHRLSPGSQRFSGRAGISGIGQTELTRESGRSVLDQALEAARSAIVDAGLEPGEIDGILSYHMGDSVPVLAVAKALGLKELRWHNDIHGGGSQAASILIDAAMIVDNDLAKNVLVYRSMNGRSGKRMGQIGLPAGDDLEGQFLAPYGMRGPVHLFALAAQRFLYDRAMTELDLGHVAVAERENALANPRALQRTPLTLDDHQASPYVAEPLRRLDCCLETDGAAAVVISRRTGSGGSGRMVGIHAGVRGGRPGSSTPDRAEDLGEVFSSVVAAPLYEAAGMTPEDIDVALLYDAYTYIVLAQLEDFGFCGRGESGKFVANGGIAPRGSCPVNPHGGLLSEGYVHGLNNVTEAVRQLRGEGINQVLEASVALCTGFGGGYGSAVLLVRDF